MGIVDKKGCLDIPLNDWKIIELKIESVYNIQNDPDYEYYAIQYDMVR